MSTERNTLALRRQSIRILSPSELRAAHGGRGNGTGTHTGTGTTGCTGTTGNGTKTKK